jgi:DNA-binding MarR family transcriptional regulator
MSTSKGPMPLDPLFPSGYFAKVPAEALSALAHSGAAALSHAEFRVLVSLLRFRGAERVVNPKRGTLERMTGMTPNNISRCTRGLQSKGWLTIHYEDARTRRVVANYELRIPAQAKAASANGVSQAQPDTPWRLASAATADEVYSFSQEELDELYAEAGGLH